MGNPIPSSDAMNLAADIAEKFVLADFGGNDIAGLRNGIMADAAIADFVQSVANIRADAYEQAAKWLRSDAKLCDCFARSSGECGCGAWDDHKTVAMSDLINRFEQEFALSDQPASTNEGLAELLRECRKDFGRCADIVDRHLYRQSEKVEDVRLIALSAVTRIDTALSTGRQA